jgi:hypothetical protein
MAKLWFGQEKKGFNQLGDYLWIDCDFRSVGATLFFDEMRILATDDGDFILGMNLLGGKDFSDKVDLKLFPMAVALWIHKPGTKYEIYSLDEKKKVEIEATPLEAVIHLALTKMDVSLFYKGELAIVASPVNEKVLSAPELIDVLTPFKLTQIPELTKLKDLRIESSKVGGKGGFKGASGQKQKEKLADNQAALFEIASSVSGTPITSWNDFYLFSATDAEQYAFVADSFRLLK